MKHIFVVNPAAGNGKKLPALLSAISYACQEMNADFQIYHTTTIGDGVRFVAETCNKYPDVPLRFYACGGDGTLNEVVNGAVGHPNVEVGIVPSGTGNDFVRAFSEPAMFFDIRRQLLGKPIKIDLIKFNRRYCVNVLNIGFDCDVVQTVEHIKRSALVPANFAYIFGVIGTFTKPIGKSFKVLIDDKEFIDQSFALCALANANFYGGGFKVAPCAYLDDGLMDLCLVDRVSHGTFVNLITKYKVGKHVAEDGTSLFPFIRYQKCKKIIIKSETPMGVCADGEVTPHRRIVIENMPGALNIVVPKGCSCLSLKPEDPISEMKETEALVESELN